MARFGGLEADKVDDKRALLAALAPLQHLAGRFCFQPINWRRLLVAGRVWCAARALMRISRIAATAARHTSASSNGLPRSRSATACRYMSRRVRGT